MKRAVFLLTAVLLTAACTREQIDPAGERLLPGQRIVTLGVSARYVLDNNFTMRLFYDRVVNSPFVSSSYRTSNSSFGFSLQFMLAN